MTWQPYLGDAYLDYEQIVAWCRAAALAYPDHVALKMIGQSREGRPLALLTIGDRSGARPGASPR